MHDTKRKILNAASELFLEGGASSLSVRAISKRADLSTIGIYSHFQGKQGILDALYIEGFERVAAAMTVPATPDEPIKAVITAIENYLNVAEAYEAHYRLIFGESDTKFTPSDEAKAVGAKAFMLLIDLVATALPIDATKEDGLESALAIWAIVHGFTSLKHHTIHEFMNVDWRALVLEAVRRQMTVLQNV